PIAAESLAEFLQADGYDTTTSLDGEEALEALAQAGRAPVSGDQGVPRPFGVAICDLAMPRLSGLELLKRITKEHPTVAVVIITGYGAIDSAVEAVRGGAVDYLTKPVVDKELRFALERAVRQHLLLLENHTLKSQLDDRYGLENIIGSDH